MMVRRGGNDGFGQLNTVPKLVYGVIRKERHGLVGIVAVQVPDMLSEHSVQAAQLGCRNRRWVLREGGRRKGKHERGGRRHGDQI